MKIDKDVTDEMIKAMDKTAIQVILDPSTTDFLQSTKEEYNKITNTINFLNAVSYSQNIESIYIYDMDKQSVAASNPIGYVSNIELFTDQEWIADLNQINGMVVKARMDKRTNEALISLFRPILLSARKKGILVINVPLKDFFSNPVYLDNEVPRSRYVFDAEGSPILVKEQLGLSTEEVAAVVQQGNLGSASAQTANWKEHIVYALKSDYTGWSFVIVLPEQILFKRMYWIRDVVLLLSVLIALFSVIMICMINFQMLQPIRRMRKLLIPFEKSYQEPELLDLQNLMTKILNDHSHMFKQIKTTIPEIRKRFLEDVLVEQTDHVELYQKWKDHFSEWQNGPAYISVISIDNYMAWSANYNKSDLHLMLFALGNIVEECLNPDFRMVMIQHGREGLCLLVQPLRDWDQEQFLESLDRIIAEVNIYIKMFISIGLSDPVQHTHHLPQAYRQALGALAQRLYQGYGHTHTVNKQENHAVGEFDNTLIQGIVQAVHSGEERHVWSATNALFDAAETGEFPPLTVIAALENLQIALEQTAEKFGKSVAGAMRAYTKNPKINSMDLADLRKHFNASLACLLLAIREQSTSKNSQVIHQMIAYMQQHLQDNIGVKDIADAVQLSLYQANQLFKQETDHTVYEYISKLRIESSERLLADTDYKVFEIAEMVGYQNENSFIRAFRNVKGMTPGKYREWLKRGNQRG
ncbi:helix-turn-helix domain-containing protein [Paenibacillus koleovorans]|uniref:helix-turn-helix domain-containing protein n=1 Tax=Paenibacillus koleovorans TaxID=121608 RepID=UPI0013E3D7AB|nr:helix-turn-helix domain-containing protein [Paenibacillus koleovorans]